MLYDRFIRECGMGKFTFQTETPRRVGLKYVFKFGKYKGMSLFDVLLVDKDYLKYLHENNQISFTKKDKDKLMGVLYGSGQIIS